MHVYITDLILAYFSSFEYHIFSALGIGKYKMLTHNSIFGLVSYELLCIAPDVSVASITTNYLLISKIHWWTNLLTYNRDIIKQSCRSQTQCDQKIDLFQVLVTFYILNFLRYPTRLSLASEVSTRHPKSLSNNTHEKEISNKTLEKTCAQLMQHATVD